MDWYQEVKRLSKDLGLKMGEVLALSSGYDPFHFGTKADREKAEWAKEIWDWVKANWDKQRERLLALGYDIGTKPYLRGIHYVYLTGYPNPTKPDGKPYLGTHKDWQLLIRAFIRAKVLGYIPFGEILDRKHPKPIVNIIRGTDGEIYYGEGEASDELTAEDVKISLATDIVSNLEIGLYEKLKDVQSRFPFHLEFWAEKESVIIDQVASRYWVTVQPSVGEQTYEKVYDLLVRANTLSEGRPVRIYYISDYDPRGEFTIPVAVARKIEWLIKNSEEFEGMDIKLKKICLTGEQVERLKLPPAPVKEKESMKKRWMEQRGGGIVEINSIESLHPEEFIRILEDAVKPYYDRDTIKKIRDFNNQAEQAVTEFNEMVEEAVNKRIGALGESIQEKVQGVLGDFSAELHFDFTEEQEEIEELEENWEEPEWNHPEENEDDWLFSSERSYINQIGYYKRVRG